jgi:hypothetical protein
MTVGREISGIHGSIVGCIYLFQFNFGNFWRKSLKQATVLYVHCPLLKTPLRKLLSCQKWITP